MNTVGSYENEGKRYPLLNVDTQSQLLQDATVASTFWGHQGYVAWGSRSPQAQKAVNRLLEGKDQDPKEAQAEMIRRQKRSKPPPPLHFTDSHVVIGPNGVDPSVRLGTPPTPYQSTPMHPAPRVSSPSGTPPAHAGTTGTPTARKSPKGGGLMSAAMDDAARSAAQHVKVGRHGRGPGAGVRPKSNRTKRGPSLTPTTVSDWEILLEQNRSRMMSSIEDVTNLIGLPLQDTFAKVPPLSHPSTRAKATATKTGAADQRKRQQQQLHKQQQQKQQQQQALQSKGGRGSPLHAAAAVHGAGTGVPGSQPINVEEANPDVDEILAPLGPWQGPQALGAPPPPRLWGQADPQAIQQQQLLQQEELHRQQQHKLEQHIQQQHAEQQHQHQHQQQRSSTSLHSRHSSSDYASSSASPTHTAEHEHSHLSHLNPIQPGSPLQPRTAWGPPQHGTSTAEGAEAAASPSAFGQPHWPSPLEQARAAHFKSMQEESQALLQAQQAMLHQGQRPPEHQQPPQSQPLPEHQPALHTPSKADGDHVWSEGRVGSSGRDVREGGRPGAAGDRRSHTSHRQSSAGGAEGRGYQQQQQQQQQLGESVSGWERLEGGFVHEDLEGEASFSEQVLGVEDEDGRVKRRVSTGSRGAASDIVAEASFTALPEAEGSEGALRAATAEAAGGGDTGAGDRAAARAHVGVGHGRDREGVEVRRDLRSERSEPVVVDLGRAHASPTRTLRASHSSLGAREVLPTAAPSTEGTETPDRARGEGGGRLARSSSASGWGAGRAGHPAWPAVPLDTSWVEGKEGREGGQGADAGALGDGASSRRGDSGEARESPYPYFYSEEQRREMEQEEQQEQQQHQPVSEQQRQQLQQQLVDAGIDIPEGSRVVGLQTRGVPSAGPSTRTPSGRAAQQASGPGDGVQDTAQGKSEQEVLVVMEDGRGSKDGEQQEGASPRTTRTRTVMLPPKHPVLTSGIQYTVVKAVGVPLMRRSEAEEEERVMRLAELEAELGAPALAQQRKEGQRAGKALRRISGSNEGPPSPPSQGVSMIKTVPGRRQPSPGPREEVPQVPPTLPSPSPMPIPTLSTRPRAPATNPAPKVPHSLPPIQKSNSDKEKLKPSVATTFGHAITEAGKAKVQDVWM